MKTLTKLEIERVALQEACDKAKTQGERNRLGQFATPQTLALEIMQLAKNLLPASVKIRFLDPIVLELRSTKTEGKRKNEEGGAKAKTA